jgi:hypothetical protein
MFKSYIKICTDALQPVRYIVGRSFFILVINKRLFFLWVQRLPRKELSGVQKQSSISEAEQRAVS